MNRLSVAVFAIAMSMTPAFAGNNQPPPPEIGGTWNYNYNYNYKYKNDNGDWYQNPYLWGSVAGLLGELLQPPPQYIMPPPQYAAPPGVYAPPPGAMGGPECAMVWTQVYIPGKGYVPYQTTVCP